VCNYEKEKEKGKAKSSKHMSMLDKRKYHVEKNHITAEPGRKAAAMYGPTCRYYLRYE
jgi:hypothetical protein